MEAIHSSLRVGDTYGSILVFRAKSKNLDTGRCKEVVLRTDRLPVHSRLATVSAKRAPCSVDWPQSHCPLEVMGSGKGGTVCE